MEEDDASLDLHLPNNTPSRFSLYEIVFLCLVIVIVSLSLFPSSILCSHACFVSEKESE